MRFFRFLVLTAVLPMFSSGCSVFTPEENTFGYSSPVSQLRFRDILKMKSFRCFLAPGTPDAVRIVLTDSFEKQGLVPSFRTVEEEIFPECLRSGRADAAFLPLDDEGSVLPHLHGVPLRIGGAPAGILLIRADDPDWEKVVRKALD